MSAGGGGSRTVVHLLRHGEVHNPTGILYGRLPGFKLSERGQKQALIVAEHLNDHDIAHVVASPLDRAQQTAAPIADSHRLELATDHRLIEADNRFEGLKVAVGDGALRSPRHWPKLVNPFQPSWGEPYLEIAHRMLGAVQRARAAAEGHEAVCVSHQLPIWTLRRFLEGKRMWHDPRRRECSLASLTSLVFEGEELVRLVYTEPAGATSPRVTGA
ncbi:histidine phosphatase family protein [Saccharothrix australiensis]|uniref:histidine phosphatase family protein n=1 Tax=Saccharothrix australiensis TaxID=2072 RepID=UPI000EACCFDE|nr:histidine phosphatase family protein [Saccharothrix australiensis]